MRKFLFSHNTEKVIYFLLLERKRRRPACEDELEVMRGGMRGSAGQLEADPPRKRVDTCRVNGSTALNLGQISHGSPLTPRRQSRYLNSLEPSRSISASFPADEANATLEHINARFDNYGQL